MSSSKTLCYLHHVTKSSQIAEQIHLNDTWANTPIGRGSLFSECFDSVYSSREANVFDNFTFSSSPLPHLHDMYIDEDKAPELLSSLNSSKAKGMDDIGPKLFKLALCPCLFTLLSNFEDVCQKLPFQMNGNFIAQLQF